jgi:hypothetical protein
VRGGFTGAVTGGFTGGFTGGVAGGFTGAVTGGFTGGLAGGLTGAVTGALTGALKGGWIGGQTVGGGHTQLQWLPSLPSSSLPSSLPWLQPLFHKLLSAKAEEVKATRRAKVMFLKIMILLFEDCWIFEIMRRVCLWRMVAKTERQDTRINRITFRHCQFLELNLAMLYLSPVGQALNVVFTKTKIIMIFLGRAL